MIMAI